SVEGTHILVADGQASPGFVFQDNIALNGDYGVFGSGAGQGTACLNAYFPGAVFQRNVIIGGLSTIYPANNYFPPSPLNVGFADYANNNLALLATSPYIQAATDGTQIGANIPALLPYINSVVSGGIPLVPGAPVSSACPGPATGSFTACYYNNLTLS